MLSKPFSNCISILKGVGDVTLLKLQKLNIYTITDLLLHLPKRYEDKTILTPLNDMTNGNKYLIEGVIAKIQKNSKNKMTKVTLTDKVASVELLFFNLPFYQIRLLQPAIRLRCFGQVQFTSTRVAQLLHPEYILIKPNQNLAIDKNLQAIYPSCAQLSQNLIRKIMNQALLWLQQNPELILPEILPTKVLLAFTIPSIQTAIQHIHQPTVIDKNENNKLENYYYKRLVIEKLITYHIAVKNLSKNLHTKMAHPINMQKDLQKQFIQQLPFILTQAQEKAINEILADINKPSPMYRLLQGDVGSGKTVVLAVAALMAIMDGYQVALMSPTAILARQHFDNFIKWFSVYNINIALLTSVDKTKSNIEKIQAGTIHMVVGTHALFEQDIHFKNLNLIIIDEQHRFGVNQRNLLHVKGAQEAYVAHQLVLSATPIPRTLAMTLYANLKISIINELPPNRKPIQTAVINNEKRELIVKKLQQMIAQGGQAYWVCTVIEETETLVNIALQQIFNELKMGLPEARIAIIHGKLKEKDKVEIMGNFKKHTIDILVATSVIEVGVDVPNAQVMIIENAERLGLAQMHQLRGRVGRGARASFCILLYQAPLSSIANTRLKAMRDTQDGFQLANMDLQLRGPGEILGTQQSGVIPDFMADLPHHEEWLSDIETTVTLLENHYPEAIDMLCKRWSKN